MFKYLFCFLFIFLHPGPEPVFAQNEVDSAASVEIHADRLNQPVADSGYLSTEPVREVPREPFHSYLKNPDYAYANDPAYWKKEAPQKPGILFRILSSGLLKRIILLGFIVIGLYGIYRLVIENQFGWLIRKSKKTFSEPDEQAPVEEMDYEAAIQKYQSEGNYRQAVRFLYLRLIRTAREKSGLTISGSSTNAEIALAFGLHPKAGAFRYLATAYEYIYYGSFHPNQELFDMLKNKFDDFQQTLSL